MVQAKILSLRRQIMDAYTEGKLDAVTFNSMGIDLNFIEDEVKRLNEKVSVLKFSQDCLLNR